MSNLPIERRIIAGQIEERLKFIAKAIYWGRHPIADVAAKVTGADLGPERAPKAGYQNFNVPGHWGGFDQTTWFRLRVTIPEDFTGRRVVALIHPGGESLAFVDGVPTQGLDEKRDLLLLTEKARGGEDFEILLESVPSTRFDTIQAFGYADLAVMQPEVWDFYWDVRVTLDVLKELDENDAKTQRMLDVLDQSIKLVDMTSPENEALLEGVKKARRHLARGLKPFRAQEGGGHLTMVGHSHIDTAWLWPMRETERKTGRTFSTVLSLMERYPEYRFSCSQPAQYEFVKKHFPELYEGIKRRVKEGRWEPNGCFWVEPDLNVPSGEALVRQAVYGNRFFRQEFGMHSRTAWTPDTFGYCYALPQILRRAQVDSFITTKILWNEYTDFPYSVFMWEGTDGSQVLAMMPRDYNGRINPLELRAQWAGNKQKNKVDEFIFPFGWGDGGGGPTAEMMENGRRLGDRHGLPKASFGTVQDCVDRVRASCPESDLPRWNGELYFELHRGCQTTHARNKRHNRQCEYLLQDAEFVGAWNLLLGGQYEQDKLYEAWKTVLTNQFHDILPGTSITEVYRKTEEDYAAVRADIGGLLEKSVRYLARQIDTRGEGQAILVVNTLSWPRDDVVRATVDLPQGDFHVVGPHGVPVPSQRIGENEVLFEVIDFPPLGYAVYHVRPGQADREITGLLQARPGMLENDYLKVGLDKYGRINSVRDKLEQRELVPKGQKANVLQLFEDVPHVWEAWDIDYNFEEKMWEPDAPESVEVIEEGPVRAVVRVVRKTGQSTITQDITLYASLARVDFVTHVDWWERRTLLKAAFPLDLRSQRATFEVQYGAVERPTHRNREADAAQFEVPAQRWADLSEGDYGVSLLNDSKYGYDVRDNVMRISLLRGPTEPDPTADEGPHSFVYSLFPHELDWRSGTVQEAQELNRPLLAMPAAGSKGGLPRVAAFATVDVDHVLLDTVKRAEDSDQVIVRLYEAYGQRGEVTVTFDRPVQAVAECDLMEENDETVKTKGTSFRYYTKPWEIRTFKIQFG